MSIINEFISYLIKYNQKILLKFINFIFILFNPLLFYQYHKNYINFFPLKKYRQNLLKQTYIIKFMYFYFHFLFWQIFFLIFFFNIHLLFNIIRFLSKNLCQTEMCMAKCLFVRIFYKYIHMYIFLYIIFKYHTHV